MQENCVEEWLIQIHGQVQGVGFRTAASRFAELYQITGTVRNRADGSVEIVAQGRKTDIKAFLTALKNRPGRGAIDKVDIERRNPEKRFDAFKVY